ncbi:hypothetical protein [Cohaesibacter celericrescens]|uniref:Uncharacterized protein n=1 Tax=Cohaesibacter celericrescens TaxID=2067669 RepID=A0A2N5XTE6_9HYPH|nr:hypothetical protein [Cohaesibacter celericrescens]PLW77769.1 hypothetical protein C0081_07775 [Cohaesibacter celericrescens]
MKKSKDWSMGRIARDISGKAVDAALDASEKALDTAKSKSAESIHQFAENQKPLSAENWFERTAEACESMSDAIMGSSGWTNKLVSVASSKLGAMAAPASLVSVAALVGTASTGTAIGTLSGAASTSAALAWLGGSVAMGTAIVTTAGVGGMIAAPLLVKPLSEKYLTGQARNPNELSRTEHDLVNACCALAIGLREAAKDGDLLNSRKATALLNDALKPLIDKSADILWTSRQWPLLQRRKFNNAYLLLGQSKGFANDLTANREPIVVGFATSLILNLLSEGERSFSEEELDVLEAIRRSGTALNGANNDEIAIHVQDMDPEELLEFKEKIEVHIRDMTPEQLQGFRNNIKGITHELRYAREENSDGDMFEVELFEATNHPGADIKLINIETGEIRELQLKATSYGKYVEEHFAKYPDIDVLATTEVSEALDVETTGISNEQLSADIGSTMEELASTDSIEITDSMAIAGLVTLARNVNIILTSDPEKKAKRSALVSQSIKAGLVAGIAELVV